MDAHRSPCDELRHLPVVVIDRIPALPLVRRIAQQGIAKLPEPARSARPPFAGPRPEAHSADLGGRRAAAAAAIAVSAAAAAAAAAATAVRGEHERKERRVKLSPAAVGGGGGANGGGGGSACAQAEGCWVFLSVLFPPGRAAWQAYATHTRRDDPGLDAPPEEASLFFKARTADGLPLPSAQQGGGADCLLHALLPTKVASPFAGHVQAADL